MEAHKIRSCPVLQMRKLRLKYLTTLLLKVKELVRVSEWYQDSALSQAHNAAAQPKR